MENSPISRLPAELRNAIWELLLREEEPIDLHCQGSRLAISRKRPTHQAGPELPPDLALCKIAPRLALLATCRAISAESSGIFYSSNRFTIEQHDWPDEPDTQVDRFKKQIGRRNARALRQITIKHVFGGEIDRYKATVPKRLQSYLIGLHGKLICIFFAAKNIEKAGVTRVTINFGLPFHLGAHVIDLIDLEGSWERIMLNVSAEVEKHCWMPGIHLDAMLGICDELGKTLQAMVLMVATRQVDDLLK